MNRVSTSPIGSDRDIAPLAPPAVSFPDYPASWHLLGPADELRDKPLSREGSGRRLVIFRDERKQPVALHGDCAHMGADLSGGCVVDGHIRCPFHGFEYDSAGVCVRIPAQQRVPLFLRQEAYPVVERHGLLFVSSSVRPPFTLPSLFEPESARFVPSRPARYVAECPWWMFGANGFDMQHFALVHDRQLLDEPQVDTPAPGARRIRFRSRVIGNSAVDRLLRSVAGEQVNVAITVWGGNLIVVTASFRRAVSRLLFATAPVGRDKTEVALIVFVERRGWRRVLEPLSLWVRLRFSMAFVDDDMDRVRRTTYRPEMLIDADRPMIDYYRWLFGLSDPSKELA